MDFLYLGLRAHRAVVLTLVGAALFPSWAMAQPSAKPAAPPTSFDIPVDERAARAAGIGLSPILRERGATDLAFPGSIVVPPPQLHVVAAPLNGLIESVAVATDESVSAGQVIVWIRSPALVEAQRDFVAAVAEAQLTQDRTRRTEALFAARALAERDLLTAQNASRTATYRADERQHALELMGMSAEAIQELRRTREFRPSIGIAAPQSGIILIRHKNPGERVEAAAPLFTIATLDPLWVNIQVPASRLGSVTVGSQVVLPAQGASGRIIRIGRSIDPATQSVTAVAQIDTNSGSVRPGLAVTVNVRLEQNGIAQWVVPAAAVVRHRDRSWTFVRTPTGFRATPVQVVSENARDVSIRADLAATDQVADRGVIALLAELAKIDAE